MTPVAAEEIATRRASSQNKAPEDDSNEAPFVATLGACRESEQIRISGLIMSGGNFSNENEKISFSILH